MNNPNQDQAELERHLRAALRPLTPPGGIAERIIQRAERRRRVTLYRYAAIAAMLAILCGASFQFFQQRRQSIREQEVLKTAAQLQLALRITSQKIERTEQRLRQKFHHEDQVQ